ncbi:hypothetical protein LZ24_02827 [Desulfobotulus alkaliphilus]|uniref:WD40 repeat protein n=1 Tax=Desulfobotulus alkaliphilus TaxID=622671 RepID=A0A562RD32_9BACT|nr:WD40 repeat domain-containing protein [Desulfobotulus alkaliphilus]TWI66928.1 hypothetical protein LZ24_02827 [Desulfobotulus alkaliphilus]
MITSLTRIIFVVLFIGVTACQSSKTGSPVKQQPAQTPPTMSQQSQSYEQAQTGVQKSETGVGSKGVRSVAPEIAPDERLAAFSHESSNILYWDSDSQHQSWGATRISFWPGGNVFFSRERLLNYVRVWDAARKKEIGRLEGLTIKTSTSTSAMAVSLDGAVLASAGDDEIMLWQAPLGPKITTIPESATDLAFYGATGEWLLSVKGNQITLWHIQDDQVLRHTVKTVKPRLRRNETVRTSSLNVTPPSLDNALLYALVSTRYRNSHSVSLKTWQLPSFQEGPFTVENVKQAALSPDGKYLAVIRSTGEDLNQIEILDPQNGQVWDTFRPETSLQPRTLSFSNDSRILMVGHYGQQKSRISVWDIGSRLPIMVISPTLSPPATTPDGKPVFDPGRRWPGPVVVSFSHNNKWMAIGGGSMPLDLVPVTWKTVREQRVADRLREGRELLRLGFAEQGLEKLKAVIAEDPYHNPFIENDLLYGELTDELSPRYLGKLLLYHAEQLLALDEPEDQVTSYTHAVLLYRQFGALAARSGQPHIAAATLARMHQLIESDSPRALLHDINSKFALMLETQLKVLTEGPESAYLHLLQQGGWIVDDQRWIVSDILSNPDLWAPLYQDRAKLAYFLRLDEKDLPRPAASPIIAQPYPDLTGKIREAVAAPPELQGGEVPLLEQVRETSPPRGRILD